MLAYVFLAGLSLSAGPESRSLSKGPYVHWRCVMLDTCVSSVARLADGVLSQALHNLTVGRELFFEAEFLALHDQEQGLLGVRQVRRSKDQRRAEGQRVGDAFLLQEPPVPVRADDTGSGLVQ